MRVANEETIAALSTPVGESGIAVIRVTGPEALAVVRRVFSPARAHRSDGDLEHHRVYHGYVVGGDEIVDEVMCAVMHGPDSYTGQDTVEISCHGNSALVSRVLELLYGAGARAAEAGEFTKRAFLNGKMDLIQAEAVADLIHSRSELQRRVAQAQLAGNLSKRINTLAAELLDLLCVIEANIDFIEDDIDTLDVETSVEMLRRHGETLDELLAGAEFSRPFREGYRVTIAGAVNAGKSSLFNRLVGESRAIVTEIPGTTRDVLREPLVFDGLLFILQDTAGLRGTEDRIESIGVELARTAMSEADIVLYVVDATVPPPGDLDRTIEALDSDRAVVTLSKTDQPRGVTEANLSARYPGRRIVETSAETGAGVDLLKKSLVECVGRDQLNWVARERVVLNTRLLATLREAAAQIAVLQKALEERAPLEILALDAREALGLYEAATGKRYSEDLLDRIFSRFCIGK
ncbi:MAG: tRNA uridine-5-carboxymethylaminomethyl(34) synthesis GTPase MnmE [Candidatus Krumholzibacteriia bacterium]